MSGTPQAIPDDAQQARFAAVDRFVNAHCLAEDAALTARLDALQRASDAAGLPPIQVSAAMGKFLHLLVRLMGAQHVLEIGTLGGYSTCWLAAALPTGGRVITLEHDEHHATVAEGNIAEAGFAEPVDLRVGDALDTLDGMVAAREAGDADGLPIDLAFIDADKQRIPEYVDRCVRLARPGSAIVVDNVVRRGDVIDEANTDDRVLGVRRMYEQLRDHPRLSSAALQTVGEKGHDGFVLALVSA
jgi:predicted O-methyltransferase YrrM